MTHDPLISESESRVIERLPVYLQSNEFNAILNLVADAVVHRHTCRAASNPVTSVSAGDLAPVQSRAETKQYAGESDSARTPSVDPAPVFASSPIKKGDSEGGSPALHHSESDPPAQQFYSLGAPQLPNPFHVWRAKYTPEQLNAALSLIVDFPDDSDREIAASAGVTDFALRDIRNVHRKRIEWLRTQTRTVVNLYLDALLAVNVWRVNLKTPKHTGESGPCPIPPEDPAPSSNPQTNAGEPGLCDASPGEPAPTLPAPQAGESDVSSLSTDEPAPISKPAKTPPRTSLRDFKEDEFNASAFGTPPVPRPADAPPPRRVQFDASECIDRWWGRKNA